MMYSLCFASWCISVTSRIEHVKTVRPSHFLQFFLLLLVPNEAYWVQRMRAYDDAILRASAYVHGFALILLICIESCGKRHLFVSGPDQQLSVEETCGLFGRRLFWYLNTLFLKAYRNTIVLDDLPKIDAQLVSEDTVERFRVRWSRRSNQSGRQALLRSIFAVLWKEMCIAVVPRVLELGILLTQPFLISAMLVQIRDPDRNPSVKDSMMLGAFAANFFVSAIFSSWYSHSITRFTVKLRSILVTAIYDKALRANSREADIGSATVLMNVDLERVLEGMKFMHEIWAVPIGIVVCLYMLFTNLGWAFVVPLIIVILAAGLTWDIGDNMTARNLNWVTRTEKRITTMSKIASSLKEVRILGLTEILHKTMTALRVDELLAYRSTSSLWAFVVGSGFAMFPIMIFGTVTVVSVTSLRGGVPLDYDGLFTSLSILKLIASQMLPMLQELITFQGAAASFDRMQAYLLSQEEYDMDYFGESVGPSEDFQIAHPDGFELQETFSEPSRNKAFNITGASFGFGYGPTLLHHITLTIEEGSFTMIIGKVGSGKSLMLQSLIGEMTKLEGVFERSHSLVSYCAQSVWLRNVSVRDNILGESDFEDSWYNAVVRACVLEQDFAELPNGDATLVGSSAMALSGGQKNRISLARAVYSRRPVVIVDDILSGLDSTTEKLVFSRVFGPEGLLREINSTVVIATHSIRWTAQSDKIVVMSKGSIIAHGSHESLLQTPELWETFCLPHEEAVFAEEQRPDHSSTLDSEKKEVAEIATVPELEKKDYRRKGESGTLLYYLKGVGKTRTVIYFILMTSAYTLNAVQFIWVQKLLKDSVSVVLFCRSISIFTAISLVAFFLVGLFLTYFFVILCPRSGLQMHARQLSVFMKAHFTAIVTKDVGDIINLFSQDTVIVDRLLPILSLNISTGFVEQTKNCIILTAATPPILVVIPFFVAIGYAVQHFYLRTSRQLRHLDLEAKAPLCTNFLETLSGSATIRAFGWFAAFESRNSKLLLQSQAPYYLLQDTQNWLSLVLDLMVAGIVSILVGLALLFRAKIDPGFVALALVGVMDLGFGIRILVLAWTEVETAMSAVTRIRLFLENTSQEPISYSDFSDPLWPSEGAVHFRNVSSSYTPDINVPATLRSIDLKICAGEKIGICGRTGSGKSSLIATLLGLMHQTTGEILIDGVSTTTLPLSTLRTRIISLTQEPFFLEKSVRENLVPWTHTSGLYDKTEIEQQSLAPSDDDMICALQKCGIWEKLAAAAPEVESGLAVSLATVDSLLSEGEKQLFCLARAILHPGKLVLLDEATSR
ncbi:P-loop containing nucleoside triphosphate hydrolase protein [Didymella exigua CBS 183.55]|uniref:P-loop containing nucleoside triphosphate hydrolase protein n=1 Tax=Didymella exigua CBS 183.55 TaxID=1150837 RepID=A0A6A5S3W4_9PLEO|nr:P-loop containing nucleoside triphosphate hydrolase protein [Didymella exigua CBS 183.55]KAF1934459.1 P-loop containing nucleoside triphosphate hydrolase protein [Didymella exigua CBS 183.55]